MIDSQLMSRYVGGHDTLAFGDLVARHSPAVLRVCRRFVHDPHAAEDAMQATFLILVQRAPSIQQPDQLDRWLAGVARRVAARARRRELRRSEREQRWAETRPEASTEHAKPLQIELRRTLREELGQLPDADRQPLTLCYIDGLTHEEAARRIGCPVGTIKARLVRARRRLRDRLDRRGVSLSLGLLLLLLRRPATTSAAELSTESTVEAMRWVASGDLDAVRDQYPAAWRLVNSGCVARWAVSRGNFIALILSLLVVSCGSVAVVARMANERLMANSATARLTKLLDNDCQINP